MNTTVLLAEDEPVSRMFLSEALSALGLQAEVVEDGNTAVQRARTVRYAALLLDLHLPGCKGPAILAALRADPTAASRATPALALTADDSADTRTRLLAAGFAGVASKPIDLDALAAALMAIGIANARDAADAAHGPAHRDVWDDDHALAAAGGNRDIVAALRGLLRDELPRQRDAIVNALQRNDAAAARAELHRMLASTGFCGAYALGAAARRLHDVCEANASVDAPLQTWLRAVDQVLASH